MSAIFMKRPAIGIRIIRGLKIVYQLAEVSLDYDPDDLVEEQKEDARVALAYIENLCIWYKARVPRREQHGQDAHTRTTAEHRPRD